MLYTRNPYRSPYGSRGLGLEPETRVYRLMNPAATPAQIADIDLKIKAVKYGPGVTLASVTLNLSTAAGYYFLTRSSIDLRWASLISGATISVAATGTPATTAVFGGLSQGTGETVGADVYPNNTAVSDSKVEANSLGTWSAIGTPETLESIGTGSPQTGSYHFHIVESSASASGLQITAGTVGALYALSFWAKRVSGTVTANAFGAAIFSDASGTAYTQTVKYGTHIGNAEAYRVASGEGYFDNIKKLPVLTADLSGVQSSTLVNGGINTAAPTYVLTVTKP